MKRSTIVTGSLILLVALTAAYAGRGFLRDRYDAWTKPAVPTAVPYQTETPTPISSSSVTLLPTAALKPSAHPTATPVNGVNLDIPFVSQAPHMVWDADHEEFCEEAASLMVASYIHRDRSVTNPDVAEARLQDIKAWEMQTFGYFKDTTAAETARIVREYFNIPAVQVVSDPTLTQLRLWLSQGKAIIVPSAGRQLGNPNFKSPGPIYHMVVLKGYTASGLFITNDAGTRKGADYIYDPAVIMNAMHDWNNGDVPNGAKVVIVVG